MPVLQQAIKAGLVCQIKTYHQPGMINNQPVIQIHYMAKSMWAALYTLWIFSLFRQVSKTAIPSSDFLYLV